MAVKTPEEEKKLLENQTVPKQNTGYQSKWQDSINNYINQIQNRKPFEYNVNEDALYNQYANQYAQQGKMAMMDTMGQAAALTGGYGNSYAQSVGQQAYHGYLNQLNDVVPQLYSMALDRYMNEGNQMYDQLNLMQQQDNLDYGRYRDMLADQDDAYNKLVALMTGYGYKPTEDEMANAGMSDAHMRAILGLDKKKSSGRSYYSDGGIEPPDDSDPGDGEGLSDAGKLFEQKLTTAKGNVGTVDNNWKQKSYDRMQNEWVRGNLTDNDVLILTKEFGLG